VIGGEGFGFAPDRGVHHKIPQVGGVIIEDDVEIGANVCIDSGTIRPTRIGAGTKVDNLVQLAHNVETGNGCLFVAQSGVSGSTRLGNHVTFAGQSGAVGHVEVGDRSLIYARGVVTSNIPADSKISGFPGRDHKEDMKFQAALRKVPKLREAIREIVKYLKLDLKV
jgi:UDP-3-O-[3-hydroxymyristoyl] glucosamine N-acyltransferase